MILYSADGRSSAVAVKSFKGVVGYSFFNFLQTPAPICGSTDDSILHQQRYGIKEIMARHLLADVVIFILPRLFCGRAIKYLDLSLKEIKIYFLMPL